MLVRESYIYFSSFPLNTDLSKEVTKSIYWEEIPGLFGRNQNFVVNKMINTREFMNPFKISAGQ